MLTLERRESMLRLMQQKRAVTVSELSEHFFISEATIRRDLDKMAREGLVKRTYGGAVLLDGRSNEIPLLLREGENSSRKEQISQAAARLVSDGNILFLDSSSTVLRLVPMLSGFNGLTVVTNGLKTALKLCEYGNIKTYSTGGILRENSASVVGATAKEYISNFNADIVFFSCRGFSIESGVTEASEDEAVIKRQLLKTAKTRVLLCDSSKFDNVYFNNVCPANALDILITDGALSPENQDRIKNLGIKLMVE